MHSYGFSLFFLLAVVVSGFPDSKLYGIHIGQVVRDLNTATSYYTNILGGMRVDSISSGPVCGDEHYYRFFGKEDTDGQAAFSRQNRFINFRMFMSDIYGVPDIKCTGTHRVQWNYILFDGALVQLISFVDRNTLQPYRKHDYRMGTAKIGYAHMCFWNNPGNIIFDLINSTTSRQTEFGFTTSYARSNPGYYPGFGSSRRVESFAERDRVPWYERYYNIVPGVFGWASFRGPVGEKMEFSLRRGPGLDEHLEPFCDDEGVHQLMRTPYRENLQYQRYPSQRNAGFSHFSNTVRNTYQANEFYKEVLGGKDDLPPTAFLNAPGFWEGVMQDDYLLARQEGYTPNADYGILDIGAQPGVFQPNQMNLTFLTFDNMYLEHYSFLPNSSYRTADFDRDWTSPAYDNTMFASYWVKENVDFNSFINEIQTGANRMRLNDVFVNYAGPNRNIPVSQYTSPLTGSLQGYNYALFKGPSGEQAGLVQFTGRALAALKAAFQTYDAPSSAWFETNPWRNGQARPYCNKF